MTVGAVVLAGGASRRFGRDKLAEPVAGRPLLDHAIEAAGAVAATVVVVLAPADERPLPDGVTRAHDATAYEGPLAGLAAGLGALPSDVDRVLVLGGDMPAAVAPVLRLLVTRLDTPTITGAWLADAMGRPRPLPMALRRDLAETKASALLDAGERRLRALPEALGAWAFPLAAWRALDPELATLRDVDAPGDL